MFKNWLIFLLLMAPPAAVPKAFNKKYAVTCATAYRYVGVNPLIRSSIGWSRVCYNNKLEVYTHLKKLDVETTDEVCGCLTKGADGYVPNAFYIHKKGYGK